MATIFRFIDTDGQEKWAELSQCYNPNENRGYIPVIINEGYAGHRELRKLKIEQILEER